MHPERRLYRSGAAWLLNQLLLPVKLVVPQPVIARIPGLTSNEDIRLGLVLERTRGRLLDVGCGTNQLVARYRAQGGQGVGVDVHPWHGVDHLLEDSGRLPFEAGSFDTVSFVACLNHIPNRGEALAEARRVLADAGQLLLTNLRPGPSRLWHAWAFWDRDQHERGMQEGEVWGFEPGALQDLLSAAGFELSQRTSFSWGLNELFVCRPV